jgi:hypothetical protein
VGFGSDWQEGQSRYWGRHRRTRRSPLRATRRLLPARPARDLGPEAQPSRRPLAAVPQTTPQTTGPQATPPPADLPGPDAEPEPQRTLFLAWCADHPDRHRLPPPAPSPDRLPSAGAVTRRP